MRMHHVGLVVRDLYAQELFYRTMLDFSTEYRYSSRNTPGLRTVFLRRGDAVVELLSTEDPEKIHAASDGAVAGKGHFSLEVDSVEGEYERLRALSAPNLTPPRNTGDGFREFTLTDPEGNRIEFCRRVRPFAAPPLAGVIFDLDGTLVDSEDNYFEADRILLEEYGVAFHPDMKKKYVGYSNFLMMEELHRDYTLPDGPEVLLEKKNAIYLDLARRNTPAFPEMRRLLPLLEKRGLALAIASGSSPSVIDEVLAVAGIDAHFPLRLSAEEVPRGKPAPDIFLEAARRLALPPDSLVVMEDAKYGVEAAVRAGMRCVAIPSLPQPPLDPAFFMADLLFEAGMAAFSADAFLAWLDEQGGARENGNA